jgi:hypothetical protein
MTKWIIVLMLLVSAYAGDEPFHYKKFKVDDRDSFIPRQFTDLIDSVKNNPDYIDSKVKTNVDTIPTRDLYDPSDPEFDSYEVGDSIVVVSRKDMAFFIRDASLVTYQRTEIDSRKKLQTEFIKSAMVAEKLYKSTIDDANEFSATLYKKYEEEQAAKECWKTTFYIFGAMFSGYLLHQFAE